LSPNRRARIAIILSILLLSSLAGCSGKPAEAGGTAAPASASPAAPSPSAQASAQPASLQPEPSPTEMPKGTLVDGWVAGIPDDVPRFAYGSIDHDGSSITEGAFSTVFRLIYRDVRRQDVDAYAQALKLKGFDVAAGEIGDTYTLTASLKLEWGDITLIITLAERDGSAVYALDAPV
jgi:hypothetical protein